MSIEKHYKNDTKILMADGSIKTIDSIIVGDFVMGPNDTCKKVIETITIQSDIVKITPNKGYSFICSDTTMMSMTGVKPFLVILKPERNKRYEIHYSCQGLCKSKAFLTLQESQQFADSLPKDNYNFSSNDYLGLKKTHKKNCFLYHTEISFPERQVPMDPYIIGYWLGDGSKGAAHITTADFEIVDYFTQKLPEYNMHLSAEKGKYSYNMNKNSGRLNNFMTIIKELNLYKNKHIPDIYKINCKKVRLSLLAGLIDSDGHYDEKGKYIEISQKLTNLSDDIEYLCYSLGFMITRTPTIKYCVHKGEKRYGLYQRMNIFGDGLEEIPTIIARKKIEKRAIKKRATCFKLNVEPCGNDICYGLKLDGDQQLISNNFMVL